MNDELFVPKPPTAEFIAYEAVQKDVRETAVVRTASGNSIDQMADAVYKAVQHYVERKFRALADLMRSLEDKLDRQAQSERRVERHASHLTRLETRVAALERAAKK